MAHCLWLTEKDISGYLLTKIRRKDTTKSFLCLDIKRKWLLFESVGIHNQCRYMVENAVQNASKNFVVFDMFHLQKTSPHFRTAKILTLMSQGFIFALFKKLEQSNLCVQWNSALQWKDKEGCHKSKGGKEKKRTQRKLPLVFDIKPANIRSAENAAHKFSFHCNSRLAAWDSKLEKMKHFTLKWSFFLHIFGTMNAPSLSIDGRKTLSNYIYLSWGPGVNFDKKLTCARRLPKKNFLDLHKKTIGSWLSFGYRKMFFSQRGKAEILLITGTVNLSDYRSDRNRSLVNLGEETAASFWESSILSDFQQEETIIKKIWMSKINRKEKSASKKNFADIWHLRQTCCLMLGATIATKTPFLKKKRKTQVSGKTFPSENFSLIFMTAGKQKQSFKTSFMQNKKMRGTAVRYQTCNITKLTMNVCLRLLSSFCANTTTKRRISW